MHVYYEAVKTCNVCLEILRVSLSLPSSLCCACTPPLPFPSHPQIGVLLQSLHKQLEVKGRELSEFKDKYGIRFQGEEKETEKDSKQDSSDGKTQGSQGVLVS